MSDIDILHRLTIAEGEAKKHDGTELGELYSQQILDLTEELSPLCKVFKLVLPDDSYEELSNRIAHQPQSL